MADPRETQQIRRDEGPVIVLPDERREQLTTKLDEYRERLNDNPNMHPELQLLAGSDTMYKITVLQTLLDKGRVSTFDLSREMAKKLGDHFNPQLFNEACGVMSDYCTTGGKNTTGGTGLPQAPKR